MPSRINYIGDIRRGVWYEWYREGSNLPGLSEEKNSVSGLQSGDEGRLRDSSSSTPTCNRSGDQLLQDPGEPA